MKETPPSTMLQLQQPVVKYVQGFLEKKNNLTTFGSNVIKLFASAIYKLS
jgi:hypothetical protein